VSERGWAGIAELDPRLRDGALSRVELCSTPLARVERLEPRLNAFITLDPEQPRERAAAELRAKRLRGGHSLAVGLPLVGRPWEDGLVLRVGHAFQGVTEWHRRHPTLDR